MKFLGEDSRHTVTLQDTWQGAQFMRAHGEMGLGGHLMRHIFLHQPTQEKASRKNLSHSEVPKKLQNDLSLHIICQM